MVSISTFEWKSIKNIKKVPILDTVIMITTIAVVVITDNLAMGVIAGVVFNAVIFTWKITEVRVREYLVEYNGQTYKVYKLYGQLFFASTAKFANMFKYLQDPDNIIIDFKNSHVWDYSAVVSLSKIKEKYQNIGKSVHVVCLNNDSNAIVNKVDDTILSIS
jgi:sulfate permease, SulP family